MSSSQFEDFLKCPICFDYLNTCMITSCSHNYCSLCIRKYLTYKTQCPLCFEETCEPELRNNRLIDSIVTFYVDKNKNTLESCTRFELKSHNSTADNSVVPEGLQNHQPAQEESSEKAPCPVCNVLVKVTSINLHLDMCLNRDERMDSLRRGSSVSKRKKLAKVIYHFLSDKELKKIVGDAGLNDEGERQALIKRHKLYLVLYNSECDSLNPKPVSEIVKQVYEEEKVEEDLSKEGQKGLSLDKKMDPDLIERKQKEYMKKHQTQFSQLVEDIQQRGQKELPIASDKRKLETKNCDMDTPGTSKCKTNNVDAQENSERSPGFHKEEDDILESDDKITGSKDKIIEVEVPPTDDPLPNADFHSGSDSETEASAKTIKSTRNKLSRKNTKESVSEDSSTPVKRSRHPSDEF